MNRVIILQLVHKFADLDSYEGDPDEVMDFFCETLEEFVNNIKTHLSVELAQRLYGLKNSWGSL